MSSLGSNARQHPRGAVFESVPRSSSVGESPSKVAKDVGCRGGHEDVARMPRWWRCCRAIDGGNAGAPETAVVTCVVEAKRRSPCMLDGQVRWWWCE